MKYPLRLTSTKNEVSETTASEDASNSLDIQKEAPTNKALRKKKVSSAVPPSKTAKDIAEASTPAKPKNKGRKKPQGPFYWRNETDYFALQDKDWVATTPRDEAHMIRFQIRGNPRPLRRHRTARGFMYNPSSAYQESFRKVVHDMVWSDVEQELSNHEPLFLEEHQLVVRLVFRMKRPKNHFVSGKPGPGRLRPTAAPRLAPTRTDVDNLAKFVLDSLNGLLYVDDRQVASIQATKIFDNEGHCEGSTEVYIQRLTEEDVDELLLSRIPPS